LRIILICYWALFGKEAKMGGEEHRLDNLNKLIEEVRHILNGISFDNEFKKERLIVSQCLDQLIVEYFEFSEHKAV
jgi:hypothetical protein